MSWGTHFCHFYEDTSDLVEVVLPYIVAGLEDNEACLWLACDQYGPKEANAALRAAIADADDRFASGALEVLDCRDWYLEAGIFQQARSTEGWLTLLRRALARGFAGLRIHADESWVTGARRAALVQHERSLDAIFSGCRMMVLCTYPLAGSTGSDVFDIAGAHQFATARRRGSWEVIETVESLEAKAEIQRLNAELEARVQARTQELATASEALRRAREQAMLLRFEARLEERNRIARELHDTLLQGFTGVALQLLAVVDRVRAPQADLAALREVLELAERTLRDARQAIWDMRTPTKGQDLESVMRAAIEEVAQSSGIALHFHRSGERVPLPETTESTIVRVAREAALNAVKHSQARSLRARLDYRRRFVALVISDDGRGFVNDPAAGTFNGHLGLLGMRERAARIGGRVKVRSSPGQGTTVMLVVPNAGRRDIDTPEIARDEADGRGAAPP